MYVSDCKTLLYTYLNCVSVIISFLEHFAGISEQFTKTDIRFNKVYHLWIQLTGIDIQANIGDIILIKKNYCETFRNRVTTQTFNLPQKALV